MHRASNPVLGIPSVLGPEDPGQDKCVDEPGTLREILLALNDIAQEVPVIFPVHPRTRRRMEDGGGKVEGGNLIILEPLGYLDFLALMKDAALVVTDSGGIHEETTCLGVPFD